MNNQDRTMPTFESSTLNSQLTECLKHLQTLEDCYMVQEKFTSVFKSFLQILNACFSELISNVTSISSNQCKSKVLLCISQISKSLKLFAALLRKPLYRQGVWYVCERLRCCLSELRGLCSSSDAADDSESDSGWFLRRVDMALQLLEAKGVAAVRDALWTPLINDVICQAVTIAKIAMSLDYSEITSACQGILETNSKLQLKNESQLNSNQLSLLTDSLFSSLISLEDRVNVAILRLVLQVFSEPCRPVKQLVRQCGQAPLPRSLSDLDPMVAELDAHIERVMLIGQFAVSCSEDPARVRGMKCCLASVESIDNYLVPALKALYLTSGCEDKRKFARLLCNHWQDEASGLHSHLDNIIDSAAFSRVVQESVNDLSGRLCGEATHEIGQIIVKQCWLLYTHLSATGATSVELTQLKQSVYECEAAVNKRAPYPAVIKRVRLVMAAVDKVIDSLADTQLSQQQPPTASATASDSPRMVKSLRDLTLDISLSSTKSQHASYRPHWLQKKICEVKKNMFRESADSKTDIEVVASRESPTASAVTPKHKSVKNIYETPKNTVKTEVDLLTPFLSKTAERNTTLYVRTPRRVVQNQMEMSPVSDCSWSTVNRTDSLVLDISEILDNLSMLADTLSSDKETEAISWQQPQPSPPADVMKKYFSGNSFDSQWFSLASVRTEEVSADVETPERIQDLKHVDEKIRNLKLL